jgi:hypothetical protein
MKRSSSEHLFSFCLSPEEHSRSPRTFYSNGKLPVQESPNKMGLCVIGSSRVTVTIYGMIGWAPKLPYNKFR